MASALEICQLALAHIGERSDIGSIDPPEASIEAQRCAQFYPLSRRTLLAMENFPWSFATRRLPLADLSPLNPPPHTWGFCYGLPANVLHVIGVYEPGDWKDERKVDYVMETGEQSPEHPMVIYTNAENAVIRYVVDETMTGKFPPLFVEALSWTLAARLAGPTMKGAEGVRMANVCMETGMGFALKAMAADANQSAQRVIREDQRHNAPWIDQRGSNLWRRWDRNGN